MRKRFLIPLTLIFILIILLILFLYYFNVFSFNLNNKVIEKIDGYNYVLAKRDSALYKTHFLKLKDVLDSENVNYEDYAKEIGNLFVIDFYSFYNKKQNTDVGGAAFLNPDAKEDFLKKASYTIYKYIKELDRNKTPEVDAVVKSSVKSEKDNYIVEIKISYKNDFGFDNDIKVELAKEGKFLYITKIEGSRT